MFAIEKMIKASKAESFTMTKEMADNFAAALTAGAITIKNSAAHMIATGEVEGGLAGMKLAQANAALIVVILEGLGATPDEAKKAVIEGLNEEIKAAMAKAAEDMEEDEDVPDEIKQAMMEAMKNASRH